MRTTSGRIAPRSGPGEPWAKSFMALGAPGPIEPYRGSPGPIRVRPGEGAARSGEGAAGVGWTTGVSGGRVAGEISRAVARAATGWSGWRVARAAARAAATGPEGQRRWEFS